MIEFSGFVDDHPNIIYKVVTYKKVYTPYEIDKKFSDESEFEDGGYYIYAKILDVIEIPHDILIRFAELDRNDYGKPIKDSIIRIFYRRLSDIQLSEYMLKYEEDV